MPLRFFAAVPKDENNSDPWQHLYHMVSRGAEAELHMEAVVVDAVPSATSATEVQVGLHVGRTFAAQMFEQDGIL